MKAALRLTATLLCLLCITLAVASCDLFGVETPETSATVSADGTSESAPEKAPSIWDDALYSTDKEFGSGSKVVTVEVVAEGKTVVFTIRTDKGTVGEALLEHGLLAGEEGPYGLYIKAVNGKTLDYDKDGAYWAFYVDGAYAVTGVDETTIVETSVYLLRAEKG